MIRHFFYDKNIFGSYKPQNIFSICIGNISVGGTGKTPITLAIANSFYNKNLSSVIISRGYKRNSNGFLIVSDGNKILTDSNTSGEEPYLLANNSKSYVICDANRQRAAKYAIQELKKDLIIFDDAFQHRKILADFNIIVVDAYKGFGNSLLLPAGILRDPKSRLRKADLIVINKINEKKNETVKLINSIQSYNKNIILSELSFGKVKNNFMQFNLSDLKTVYLFCGIGNPMSFFDAFKNKMNIIKIIDKKVYQDHYKYTVSDIDKMLDDIKKIDDAILVTTEKDFYNIPQKILKANRNIFYLEMGVVFYTTGYEKIEDISTQIDMNKKL